MTSIESSARSRWSGHQEPIRRSLLVLLRRSILENAGRTPEGFERALAGSQEPALANSYLTERIRWQPVVPALRAVEDRQGQVKGRQESENSTEH